MNNSADFYYKELLEIKKLEHEIGELKRAWWKKPPWIALFITITASLTTLIFFYFNGTFDAKRTILTAGNALLELRKKEFEMQNDSLHKQRDSLILELGLIKNSLAPYTDSVRNFRDSLSSLEIKLNDAKIDVENAKRKISESYKKIDHLNDSFNFSYKIYKSQAEKISEVGMNNLRREINALKDTINRLKQNQ